MTLKCANLNTSEHELKVLRCLGMHLYVIQMCEIKLFLSEDCIEFCIFQFKVMIEF